MASVFLSYARVDAAKAQRLAEALGRSGHDVWWDRQIHGGARFSKEIKAALDRAEVVLVLWSKTSVESDWVQDEAAVGRDGGRLVPIAVEPADAPLGFRQIQTLDLVRWKGRTAPRELLQAIDAVSGSPPEAGEPNQPPTRWAHWLPRPAWLAVAVVAALVALFGLWQLTGSRFDGGETPTVAVLPFADLSPEGDKAYFSEGVGEAILSLLAREPGLKVIGRSSAAQFRGEGADFGKVRRALGVTHILEGSARTSGDQLRMSVRLIDARDGTQLWAEDYQRQLKNIFAVQDEIGRAVADRLKGTLAAPAIQSVQKPPGVDTYTLYLALRAKMRERNPKQLGEALSLARRIIAADSRYAPAHAAYAELIWLLSSENYGPLPERLAFERALPHAKRAVELAPDGAEGYAALGLLLGHRDPSAAIEPLTRAIALDPSRAESRLWRAMSYLSLGRELEVLEDLQRVIEIEPLWGVGQINFVATLATAGRQTEALALIKRFEDRGGNPGFVAWSKAANAFLDGDLSESVRHFFDARRLGLAVPQVDEFLSWMLHLASLNDAAARQASPRQSLYSRLFVSGQQPALLNALTQAGAGVWDSPDWDVAVHAFGMARDWSRLARLYDQRPPSVEVCPDLRGGAVASRRRGAGSSAVTIAQALIVAGRHEEANALLACAENGLTKFRTGRVRESGFDEATIFFTKAQILALRGRRGESVRMLDTAIERKWLSLYGGNLMDYPAFDSLPADALRRLQQKVDDRLAAERAEIKVFLPVRR